MKEKYIIDGRTENKNKFIKLKNQLEDLLSKKKLSQAHIIILNNPTEIEWRLSSQENYKLSKED